MPNILMASVWKWTLLSKKNIIPQPSPYVPSDLTSLPNLVPTKKEGEVLQKQKVSFKATAWRAMLREHRTLGKKYDFVQRDQQE